MLNLIIGPVAELAGTWLKGRVERGAAKTEAEVAKKKAEAVVYQRKANAEIDWDLEAIKGSQTSWKDEWLTILFSIPMILAFIPGMEGIVAHGFEQLSKAPDWYFYSVGLIVSASFGFRGAAKFFKK